MFEYCFPVHPFTLCVCSSTCHSITLLQKLNNCTTRTIIETNEMTDHHHHHHHSQLFAADVASSYVPGTYMHATYMAYFFAHTGTRTLCMYVCMSMHVRVLARVVEVLE